MILPANIAQEISDLATRSGTDPLGGQHYQVQSVPQALQDTPHACIYKTADLAIWDYPHFHALFLARRRPEPSDLVFYPSEPARDAAMESVRRGRLPSLEPQLER